MKAVKVFSFSLPAIALSTSVGKDPGILVVGLAQTSDGDILVGLPDDRAKASAKALGVDLATLAAQLGGSAKNGKAVLVPLPAGQKLVVVGLGPIDVTAEQVRRAVGAAVRLIDALPAKAAQQVTVSLETAEPGIIKGAAEGALLATYRYGPTKAEQPGIASITLVSANKKPEAKQALDLAAATAAAVVQARDWVNTPANYLYPETFAEAARTLARTHKLGIEVWDEKALERDGFGGLLAVGGGSSRKPRLVKLSYAPRGARFHLALVGKGITFDSGGLDLKPADGMYTMKCDMAGAASVLATVAAIAQLGLRIRVTVWAAMAENMPSGHAGRPSDVLTMFGGTTVENGNTDAEGRLVLADALAKCATETPDLVIDVATLTGACMVALGLNVAGLMARDDETADMVLDAAEAAGESFWQLPIPEDASPKLDSEVADFKSTGDRYGGALTAAAFLSKFVPEEIPWAHLDIAGPAFNSASAHDYTPTGGTGMSVRTLIALAHSRAN
ncbi:MAG: leucyl aminopeptidase [Actinobacteria bacterium]|nr:leucyl aminopeptidase [Actinomycetota bacterium]MBU4363875.1 leucyl aminopeptidase [Actinomycetota bacterium]MBU4410842.1 leucyl aminopeptidase [Actinomycetota bacterium]MBU4417332.1 leucyl aminopeptidase [Actinomycetota bacterium]MBU4586960.1 leucyl aminopeptidase [Actinomycetota bacterium]